MPDNVDRNDALTALLAERLPQYPASLALKRRLAAQWPTVEEQPRREPWWRRRALVPALAAALVLIVAMPIAYERAVLAPARATDMLVARAVTGHVHTTQTPLGVQSGGMHDVKPWFTGKLDFAPAVAFEGDAAFPLRGGALGRYGDRPAAVMVFGRRQHAITLMVVRADGLPRPAGPTTTIGRTRATVASSRGFNVVLWRANDLAYALTSDVNRAELLTLAARLAGEG